MALRILKNFKKKNSSTLKNMNVFTFKIVSFPFENQYLYFW